MPRKMPTLTTEVAMPEYCGGFASLAMVHDSVKPGISRPITKNQASVAHIGQSTCASHGSHDSV